MKKAFTMIELVFVIVVIGILAATIIPSTRTNPLQEAAIQVASHIRYTQHLAMLDDVYDASNSNWYRKRWQIVFHNTVSPDADVAYTIFSDTAGFSTGDADITEIAKNPQDNSKLLSGGYGTAIPSTNTQMTKKLNLSKSYGISSVVFGPECNAYGGTRLSFDRIGRPFQGKQLSMTGPYSASSQRLITSNCTITLSSATDNIVLTVIPETGYTSIAF